MSFGTNYFTHCLPRHQQLFIRLWLEDASEFRRIIKVKGYYILEPKEYGEDKK